MILGPVHHIGFVLRNFEKSEARYASLGYERHGDPIVDPNQDAEILFLTRPGSGSGEPLIELVRPCSEHSRVYEFAMKSKFRIHHTCFAVNDINSIVDEAKSSGFVQVMPVVIAPAIGGRPVSFLYSRETGLFEVVESPPFGPRSSSEENIDKTLSEIRL